MHRSILRLVASKAENREDLTVMLHSTAMIGLFLGLVLVTLVHTAPVEVVYTGESCACPTQLGYQLNVPNPAKPKKYVGGEYGYRVEKPVQAKAKISYSFDFTVEQPRTPAPPKNNPSNLYAKVDRITVNKSDCQAKDKTTCGCSSCSGQKPSYGEDEGYGY